MFRRFMKKRVLVALTGAAMLALAAGAYAYFTSTGTATSSATVGSASNWSVTPSAGVVTGDTALTPQSALCLPTAATYDGTDGTCAVYETVPYSIKNPSSGNQQLSHVGISISNDASQTSDWSVTNANGSCSYKDFAVDGVPGGAAQSDTTLSGDYTPSQSQSGKITVTLVDNSAAAQDGCQGVTVPLYLYAG